MDTKTKIIVSGSLLASIPKDALPASVAVDVLHLAARLKSAFRSRLTTTLALESVQLWADKNDLAMCVDEDGFICIATNKELANRVLDIDRSSEAHEIQLGTLLGYPPCCCAVVANAGESNIDMLADQIHQWAFVGESKLINPSGYLAGNSLICHLPCSPQCIQSLIIARSALLFVNRHRCAPEFMQWKRWFSSQ